MNEYIIIIDISGYLYIETALRNRNEFNCHHDHTYKLMTGAKSYILHLEQTTRRSKHVSSAKQFIICNIWPHHLV